MRALPGVDSARLCNFGRSLELARKVSLLGADLGELKGAAEAFGGGLVLAELLLQFADDGVVEMVRLDQVPFRHLLNGVESGLWAVDVGDGDGAVEGDNR